MRTKPDSRAIAKKVVEKWPIGDLPKDLRFTNSKAVIDYPYIEYTCFGKKGETL